MQKVVFHALSKSGIFSPFFWPQAVLPVAKKNEEKNDDENFERPFTPGKELAQPSDFGKTRFRRFPAFHFSTFEKTSYGIFNDFHQFLLVLKLF